MEHYSGIIKDFIVKQEDVELPVSAHLEIPRLTDICDKNVKFKTRIINQINSPTEEKSHVCELCNKVFFCKSSYGSNQYSRQNKNPPPLGIYYRGFVQKSALSAHLYVCDMCTKSVDYNRESFKPFVLACTAGKSYICKYCGKQFPNNSALSKHNVIHNNDKPYMCELCQKSFSRTESLKLHYGTHTKIKSHICEYCGKRFALRTTLKKHYVTHTKEKPHICKFCSKGFSRAASLKLHYRTHTKEKPYACDICNKTFNRAWSLKMHSYSHSSEPSPYKCEICSKCFPQKSNLDSHYFVHRRKRIAQSVAKSSVNYNVENHTENMLV